jgi:hypothetical protein
MPILPRVILKTFFEKGDIPTEAQFSSFIDSVFNLFDDNKLLGLKVHDNSVFYSIGDTCVFNGLIYEAVVATKGIFDSTKWKKLTFGALNYCGTWNAQTNINPATGLPPHLQSGVGNKGDYFIVIVAGSTNLDGENSWQVRDWAVFDGTAWQKVDNSDLDIQTAAQVSFNNIPSGMNAIDVQDAIDELQLRIDTSETDIDTLETSKEPANANIQSHIASTSNPHAVTKSQVGLSNADNTSDTDKPVSTSQAAADAAILSAAEIFSANPSNITQDATHRFVSDGQITTWNAKQDGFGYVPVPDSRKVNGHPLTTDVTVTKSDLGLGNVTNFDTTNPANIIQDTSHRFANDTQIAFWNAKQDSFGFTPVPNSTTVNGHALSSNITITKSDVGLGSVTNSDTTNPANITQDASHRFATDAQIALWNSKEGGLGYIPVPETRTVNGHALNADVTVTKSDISLGSVTNDQQVALKFYSANESASGIQNATNVFATALTMTFTPPAVADYLLEWYYEISTDTINGGNGGVQGRTLLDSTAIGQFQDIRTLANTGNPPTVVRPFAVSGFIRMTSLSAVDHIFKIEFSKISGTGNATVTRPRLAVKKV